LALIATFLAGGVTGGLLTSRAIKEAIRNGEQLASFYPIPTIDRLPRNLHLKPEQAEKVRPTLREMSDEFSNLHSLDLREQMGSCHMGKTKLIPF
jgi:hypothetical protein